MRTWVVEAVVVAFVLATVAGSTGVEPIGWICSAAVLLTFMHVQVASRLQEAEERRAMREVDKAPTSGKEVLEQVEKADGVHCHLWLKRYLVGKELLWCVYFVATKQWPALVGVFLFLLYPVWRRFHISMRWASK